MQRPSTTLENMEDEMNTCKDCKHWTLNEPVYLNKGEGICLAVHDHKLFYLAFYISYDGELVTNENFGCVAWEASIEEGKENNSG